MCLRKKRVESPMGHKQQQAEDEREEKELQKIHSSI